MFIAAQGPLNTTIKSFWKVVLNKKIKLIIMLTDLIENGRVKIYINICYN
jgi:protein tyrosine phosphatase